VCAFRFCLLFVLLSARARANEAFYTRPKLNRLLFQLLFRARTRARSSLELYFSSLRHLRIVKLPIMSGCDVVGVPSQVWPAAVRISLPPTNADGVVVAAAEKAGGHGPHGGHRSRSCSLQDGRRVLMLSATGGEETCLKWMAAFQKVLSTHRVIASRNTSPSKTSTSRNGTPSKSKAASPGQL
jgi:hypothetical protein